MLKRMFISTVLALSALDIAHADELKAKVEQAEQLGEEIYNQDIAAWVSTDSLLEYIAKNEEFGARIGGWISYADGKRYKTVFFDKNSESPRALYEVKSKERKVKDAETVDRALTKREMGLWRARELTLTQEFEACAEYTPYNSVVVEKEGGGYYAYLFASTKKNNLIVLGRHYRFDINEDATKVNNIHAFTKSCFALPLQVGENGEKPVGLMASHIVTDYPQEHHVFANLMWNIDLYVSAGEDSTLWTVSNGKIERMN